MKKGQTVMDEYKVQRQIRDLVFFAWLQGILLVVIMIVLTTMTPCQCKDGMHSRGFERPRRPNMERRSMPYDRPAAMPMEQD